jgi:hypothetical protein
MVVGFDGEWMGNFGVAKYSAWRKGSRWFRIIRRGLQ